MSNEQVQQEQLYRWVKASERLPEHNAKNIVIQFKGKPCVGDYYATPLKYFKIPALWIGIGENDKPTPEDFEYVEWLEPYTPSPTQGYSLEEVENIVISSVLYDIHKDFDDTSMEDFLVERKDFKIAFSKRFKEWANTPEGKALLMPEEEKTTKTSK